MKMLCRLLTLLLALTLSISTGCSPTLDDPDKDKTENTGGDEGSNGDNGGNEEGEGDNTEGGEGEGEEGEGGEGEGGEGEGGEGGNTEGETPEDTDPDTDYIVEDLFMDGSGAEAGQQFVKITNSVYYDTTHSGYSDLIDPLGDTEYFEIFTRLLSGESYWFKDGSGRLYNASTFKMAESESAAAGTVSVTGVYRIRIDTKGKTVYTSKVDGLDYYIGQTKSYTPMTYEGMGVWTLKNYTVKWIQAYGGQEDRYRFRLILDGRSQPIGKGNTIAGRPTDESDPAIYHLMPAKEGQWTAMFKHPKRLIDADDKQKWTCDVYVYLNNDKGHYTHEFVNDRETSSLPDQPEPEYVYRNPLFTNFSIPDPDVIRGDDGYFYSYSTEHADHNQCKNSPIMKSKDLINWEKAGSLFTDATHPHITDNPDARIWAPSINRIGNKYVCYYSQPGKNYKHAIGVATSDTPYGPFTDHGKLIDSNEQGIDISIDAYLYQEDGRNYLFWGSFRKISVIELTADGLAIKDKGTQVRKEVAGGQYEASVVVKRNGYYYLIVSTGDYKKGGTYKLVAGRSQNIFGPYVNRAGEDMMKVKHELILQGNDTFTSPGHCSRIITDDNGQDWILYHAYPQDKNFRCLMLDRIDWVDGWPAAPGKTASIGGTIKPYFQASPTS